MRDACASPYLLTLLVRLPPEHGDRLNLDQKIGPAKNCLNPGRRGQGIQFLFSVKSSPLFVKSLIVALDIAQIAGGPHDIVPGCPFGFEQLRDVVVGATKLRSEITNMYGASALLDAGCT